MTRTDWTDIHGILVYEFDLLFSSLAADVLAYHSPQSVYTL
jgi:hypothetical protein